MGGGRGGHYFRVGGVDKYCSAAKWVRLDSCQLPTAPAFMQHLIHHHQKYRDTTLRHVKLKIEVWGPKFVFSALFGLCYLFIRDKMDKLVNHLLT